MESAKIANDETKPAYERKDARLVTGIMGAKSRFGMGVTTKGGRVALKMVKEFQPQATATTPKTTVKKKAPSHQNLSILLEKTYYDPKTGFTGIRDLANKTGVSSKIVKDWLQTQDIYTLHKHKLS